MLFINECDNMIKHDKSAFELLYIYFKDNIINKKFKKYYFELGIYNNIETLEPYKHTNIYQL